MCRFIRFGSPCGNGKSEACQHQMAVLESLPKTEKLFGDPSSIFRSLPVPMCVMEIHSAYCGLINKGLLRTPHQQSRGLIVAGLSWSYYWPVTLGNLLPHPKSAASLPVQLRVFLFTGVPQTKKLPKTLGGTSKDKMLLQMLMQTQQLGSPPSGGSFISSTAMTFSCLARHEVRQNPRGISRFFAPKKSW